MSHLPWALLCPGIICRGTVTSLPYPLLAPADGNIDFEHGAVGREGGVDVGVSGWGEGDEGVDEDTAVGEDGDGGARGGCVFEVGDETFEA